MESLITGADIKKVLAMPARDGDMQWWRASFRKNRNIRCDFGLFRYGSNALSAANWSEVSTIDLFALVRFIFVHPISVRDAPKKCCTSSRVMRPT